MFGQRDQFQIDRLLLVLGEFRLVDPQIDPLHILEFAQNVEPPPPAGPPVPFGGVGDVLAFHNAEPGDDQGRIDDLRLHNVGDPPVDHDARIENQRLDPFHVGLELNEGDDEPEIVLRLKEETDPEVTEKNEHHGQDAPPQGARLVVDEIRFERRGEEEGHHQPDQKTEIDRADERHLLFGKRHIEPDHAEREDQESEKRFQVQVDVPADAPGSDDKNPDPGGHDQKDYAED